jgi:succinate dehydrogenase/fumarate reductase flavoprotein subunit
VDQVDVVVLGTGAAGLTAAITAHENGARVAIFEKGDLVGGTTAWSGGQVWIPNNEQMKKHGKHDSAEDAIVYIMSMSNGLIEHEMAETFVKSGPEMVAFFEDRTPVRFVSVPDFPDYHPEQPGARADGGRTLECPLFPFGELGEWKDRVTRSPYWPDSSVTLGETTICQAVPTPMDPDERQRRIDNDERGLGQGLIGRLLRGCLDRGIEPKTNSRAVELVMEGDCIRGVVIDGRDGPYTVECSNVILATGGFDHDKQLVKAFLRGPLDMSAAISTNTGDGLKMAMRAGAMLGNMREAWWMPIVEVPTTPAGSQLFTAERTLPGSIMINRRGQRFTNEAANYNAFGAAFHVQDTGSCSFVNLPCWVIFTQKFYETYGFAGAYADGGSPRVDAPDWVTASDTIAGLAAKLEVPAKALEATIERWNEQVAKGKDSDFHRGESVFDRWWGDPNLKGRVEATLGSIEEGPYYAVEVKSGAMGTKGGPLTDINAQVLNLDMDPIRGLYAVGNVMASPMGMTYGGGGGTLGPAMVFGYRAGRHAAKRN